MLDTSGFNISQCTPVKNPASEAKSAAGPGVERHFPLEGLTDIYEGIHSQNSSRNDGDPVYVTLGTKLFPALDALKETVGILGRNPTPDEVDRSNVRRLIRAFLPVTEAFSQCYGDKDHKKAVGEISDLADALGHYKDVSVIENVLKETLPGGAIPPRIGRELEHEYARREEKFSDTYRHFRKKGMDKALDILYHPGGVSNLSPEKMARKDRKLMARLVEDAASELRGHGLIHRDPEDFHQARKNVRQFVYATKASEDLFGFDRGDIDAMSNQTAIYGLAQDTYTACRWLRKKGFNAEADIVYRRYRQQQREALAGAQRLQESGVIERMLQKLQ